MDETHNIWTKTRYIIIAPGVRPTAVSPMINSKVGIAVTICVCGLERFHNYVALYLWNKTHIDIKNYKTVVARVIISNNILP